MCTDMLCSAGVSLVILPRQGQCFIDIWRLKFGICAVSGTFIYCGVEYWLPRVVLPSELVS